MKFSVEARARVIFALVILLGAGSALIGYLYTSRQHTRYEIVTHDSVSGLIPDAPVEFHGVEVGKVRHVKLLDPHTVSILLDVRKEIPITTATLATITSRGLATRGFTGYVYISLEDSGDGAYPLMAESGKSLPQIRTAPSRSVNLDTAISQVNDNVQAMSELLHTVLDQHTVASLKQSVNSLQQITLTLARNNKKLSSIIENTQQASTQFKPLLDSSNDTVRTLQFQILPEAYRTIDKLDTLSDSLNAVTNKINREPSILLRGSAPPQLGPGEAR